MGRKVLKQRKHAVFAAVITAGLMGIGAVPAVAASPAPAGTSETTSVQQSTGAEHCWFNAATSASECYGTEAALDTALEQLGVDQQATRTQTMEPAAATQRTVEPAAASLATAEPAMATQPAAEPAPVTEEAPSSSSLVTAGIVYANAGYSGASYRILNYGGCSAGGSAFINLADVGWNDRVTSFRGYNGCTVRLHENRDGEGATYGDYRFSSWIGAFNDRASSASFFG
ncbi:hypothetical protein [Crystallibacter degradans]|uniref:hypothetical protein n=1 Tax=Crystallibacter degradans TaxID=2726743 RepID=UPI001472B298|nr:hypothetical protein [Arthrobacter sp. SF27]NMR29425.1 hypothetical protein [Arthrobacter sp. SF27]